LLVISALLLPAACSGEAKPPAGGNEPGDALIVPEGLAVTALPGGNGVFNVLALTLRRGANNTEVYAALRNDGTTPACSPAFSIEVFDKTDQSMAAAVGGLLVQRFYRLADGTDTIAACVAPGDVTMVAITDLPAELAIEDVGHVVYWSNYWVLDVVPSAGITITDVRAVARGDGVGYTGTLVNGFDVPVASPSVAIFPVNRRGRPLGAALGRGTSAVPPGGSWNFETSSVSEAGVDHAAYPAGGP
jgi:hypothetical protein